MCKIYSLNILKTDLALNSVVSGVNIGAVESGSTGILAFSFCNESQEQLTRDNTFEYLNKNRKFQQQLLVARQHEDRRRNIQKAKENLFLSEDDYADDDDPRNRDFDEALKAEIYEEIVRKQGYAQPYLELKKTAPLAVGAYNGYLRYVLASTITAILEGTCIRLKKRPIRIVLRVHDH